jgi:DNA-binding CsgD family transcriptional regulator
VDARDGPPSAFEVLRPVYDDLDTHQGLLLEEPGAAAWLVRLALHEKARTPAIDVAALAEVLADANPEVPSLAASAANARGLLAGDPAVLQHAQDHPQPWAQASLAEDTGTMLVEHGVERPAREFLGLALAGYEGAGSVRDAGRVRARLRDLGVRRAHGRRRSRPVEGWDSLTDTERRVAELVAEGLTNQQTGVRMFVSRHTIDFHLRQIFRKLSISSRVELARIAPGRSADPRDRGM